MITAPGAAMLDQKLFVGRLDDPFPDLYERLWDGTEWIWVNHGRPQGVRMSGAPGAAMLNDKLFVVTDDGSLWERHWRVDLGQWVWQSHGRPANKRIVQGPGAAMLGRKLFVVTEDGDLWERHWRGDLLQWVWESHGRPQSRKIVTAPGAAMMNAALFVVTDDGNLWQRHWRGDLGRWVWEDHGRPASRKIVTAPGAAMNNEKLFVVTEDGDLCERHWRGPVDRWAWENHGRPGGVTLKTAPGAAMMNQKLFVGGSDGHLYERQWRSDVNRWAWQDHGRPPGTDISTEPGAAMLNSKLFVGTSNGHLYERAWAGDQWRWVDHGPAFHDQSAHIIGAPGTEPKLTVAVMGDGFAEADMDDYRRLVNDRVVAAFGLDQLGNHRAGVRLVRIDVASPVSGVTTRDYDEKGTVSAGDDTLTSENFRLSRLATSHHSRLGAVHRSPRPSGGSDTSGRYVEIREFPFRSGVGIEAIRWSECIDADRRGPRCRGATKASRLVEGGRGPGTSGEGWLFRDLRRRRTSLSLAPSSCERGHRGRERGGVRHARGLRAGRGLGADERRDDRGGALGHRRRRVRLVSVCAIPLEAVVPCPPFDLRPLTVPCEGLLRRPHPIV